MRALTMRIFISGLLLSLGLSIEVAAQSQTRTATIRRITAPPTRTLAGVDTYTAYCVPCHGEKGAGNGPVARALQRPVPDLTTIALRHGGVFPRGDVEDAVSVGPSPAREPSDMPTWGPVFLGLSRRDPGPAFLRMHNLLDYLETMQSRTSGTE